METHISKGEQCHVDMSVLSVGKIAEETRLALYSLTRARTARTKEMTVFGIEIALGGRIRCVMS